MTTALFLAAALGAPSWTLVYEQPGVTNTVTAANNPTAIAVELVRAGDQWSGTIANREPGATVLAFELRSEEIPVDDRRDRLYLPWEEGARIKVWPQADQAASDAAVDAFVSEFDKEYAANKDFWVPAGGGRFLFDPRMHVPSARGAMQWMTLSHGARGYYFATHDPRHTAKTYLGEYDAVRKRLRFGVRFNLFLGAGHDFVVAPVVAGAYEGTWHAAARRYREWWNRCFKFAYVPDRIKDMTGVLIVLLKQQNDEIIWPYTEFDSLGRCARSYGFDHVEFHAWGKGGHDRLYPEYDPDPDMGGKEELVRGLAKLRAIGVHATAYSNGQLQEREATKYWREKGKGGAIMNRDGTERTEFWHKFKNRPGHTFDVVCPWQLNWRDRMLEICRDARAYGFEGFFYDQIGVQRPFPCFNPGHGHRVGEWVYAGDRQRLFKAVADVLHSEDPEFVLASESYNDSIFDSCAWFEGWCIGRAWHRFDAEHVHDWFPEMSFYTFPEIVATDRSYTPCYDRQQMNGAVAVNCRVNFAVRYRIDRAFVEEGKVPGPEDVKYMLSPTDWQYMARCDWRGCRAYMKTVNEWRKANRELLLRGVFKADEGFAVRGDGNLIANRWDAADGRTGILVWNGELDRALQVSVSFPGQFLYAEEPEAGKVAAAGAIPANTLRLYVYRRAR
ncbi:MAG: DUF6259 domain-containing protein [Kiritimatiellia bacterium]